MVPFSESVELPEGFAGIVRLFPLPNVVMFPHVVQALHIFEPRYRKMLEDALAGDQLLAMAHLRPGWETDYEGRPPIYSVTCLGRIVAHAQLEDGRYNILLHGLRRATIVREFPPEHPFRMAEVAILEDVYAAGGAHQRSRIQRDLLRTFQQLAPNSPAAQEQIEQLLGQQVPLGALTDVVSFTLPFDLEFKQQLLAEWNVDARSMLLLQRIQQLADEKARAGDQPFPPEFSRN